MKEITKKAIRFTDIKKERDYEELIENLSSGEIHSNGQYVINFRHVPNKSGIFDDSPKPFKQTYYVNKKTYAKCVRILKERIKDKKVSECGGNQ
ncbi:hypothetical protein [Lactobacillus sp. ESL0230]|uniref:hypothetical protein n=1 Tax=Lactobacillus sp. ESL0230 TaxID=2069353 RepID=UPI000EFC0536|nr:hypothetical protein [Lactobacillus sp. ESL0230]RMC46533.1 hypothetical protein F5ESL0230_04560 [Lactobacillus sp. ESL0230]